MFTTYFSLWSVSTVLEKAYDAYLHHRYSYNTFTNTPQILQSPKKCAVVYYAYTTYRPPSGPLGPRFALALALLDVGLVNSLEADLVFPLGEGATGGIFRIPPGSTIVLITKARQNTMDIGKAPECVAYKVKVKDLVLINSPSSCLWTRRSSWRIDEISCLQSKENRLQNLWNESLV